MFFEIVNSALFCRIFYWSEVSNVEVVYFLGEIQVHIFLKLFVKHQLQRKLFSDNKENKYTRLDLRRHLANIIKIQCAHRGRIIVIYVIEQFRNIKIQVYY